MKLVGILAVAMLAFAPAALADPIQVWQESSAGAGDFYSNYLGTIDVWTPTDPTDTIAEFYQYGSPFVASYNGELNGGPNPVSSLSQLFLVQGSDGLALVVVHDKPQDGSGGSTRTRINLLGDTAAQVVADDPGEPVVVSLGGTQFDSVKNWAPCCTDGYAIGYLDGSWQALMQFVSGPTGITNWAAVGSDGNSIDLVLEPGRRVLLAPIPEPGSLLLLGAGLIGIAVWRRKRR